MKIAASPFSLAVVCAILVGSLNLFSRDLLEEGFEPIEVSICRETVTAVVFLFYMLICDRNGLRIRIRDLWIFAMFALFNVLSNFFLFAAQDMIPLGTAAVLELTSPYFIMIYAFFLFGDKVSRRKVLASVIELLGCIFIIGLLEDPDEVSGIGILFGLLSGMTLAAFTIGSKFVEKLNYSENTTMFYFFFLSSLMLLPFGDYGHMHSVVSGDLHLVADILLMGVLCTLIPNYLIIVIVRRMDPAVVAMVVTSSIVLSTAYGVLLFGDEAGIMTVIGMVLVIVAMVILEPPKRVMGWWRRKTDSHGG